RRVAGEDRMLPDVRRHLAVEVGLPVEPLGNRLDDEIALLQPVEMLVVVRRFDEARPRREGKGAGLQPFQVVDGLQHVAVGIALLGGQLEEERGHVCVHEVRRDLRAHHAGAEYGGLAHYEWGSGWHGTSDRRRLRPGAAAAPRLPGEMILAAWG